MEILRDIPLGPKTTLRIGGSARFFAEIRNREECEKAFFLAKGENIPLIVLGAGSNTIFADGFINALVVKIMSDDVRIEDGKITVESGKNLAQLVNELAERGLDISPLAGIPGTVGGAVFGNAGQGYGQRWFDQFVESIETFTKGKWKIFTRDECKFDYRTSIFKKMMEPVIIWSAKLSAPMRPSEDIKNDIGNILQKRIKSQPHKKTAGSCFISINEEMPAWKLIDACGLRGKQIGGIRVSEKHANFLENAGGATFEDAKTLVEEIRSKTAHPLAVEMRFVENNGNSLF